MRFLPASGRAPAGHTRAPADIAPRLRLHFGARSAQLLEQEGAAVASPENHQVVLGLMERQACTPPFSCKVGDVRAPPTPAAASNPQSTRSGGAVSLAAAQGKEQEVRARCFRDLLAAAAAGACVCACGDCFLPAAP
jgi:hypothetical protein